MLDKGDMYGIDGCSNPKYCRNGQPKPYEELKPKPPTYGNGLIGPPEPPYNTFHTAFQTFPALPSPSTVESFTDFSTGGNPEYTPAIYNVPVNDHQTGINNAANGLELLNGFGMGILQPFYEATSPYDQHVYINYTTHLIRLQKG